jgi:hypothetical protein
MIEEKKELYYNPKQKQFLDTVVPIKVFKGGRGSGKTRCIPEDILDRADNLPGAKIFLCGYTLKQLYDNVLPEIHDVFQIHGLDKDEHYVVNKRPPSSFDLPYKELEDYDNSISLYNGFAVQLISCGRTPEQIRGKSFDGGIIDEALLLKESVFNSIIYPTIRGRDYWGFNPYWKMLSIYSSHPRKPEGRWFLKFKELMIKYPQKYYFMEATAFDNKVVVGDDYVDNQKAVLSYIDFNVEILNRDDVKDLPSLFYHKYSERKHNYRAMNLEDYDPTQPIEMSIDFGGRFSCMPVSQRIDNEERFIYEFDTKKLTAIEKGNGTAKKLPHIIQDFIKQFQYHQNKHVKIWGDRMGDKRIDPIDTQTWFEKVVMWLTAAGWSCEVLVLDDHSAMHKSRWLFMNEIFSEENESFPSIRINELTCPHLVMSLNNTKIQDDFKKSKRCERDPDYPQEQAPHYTDALDYKIFNKYKYLLNVGVSESSLGGFNDFI